MKISGLTSFTFSIMASGWSSEVTGIGWKLRPSNKVFPDASSPGHPDKSTTFGNETLFHSILRLNRYYERRKSLRVKSHERSFSKNDEDDCRNPNGALPRPPGFFKAWKHPEEVGKRKSRSTMLRLLRSVAWVFLEWLRPRIAILRFPKQDKVHSFISKSKRGLPSVATWSKLATNFNELDAQNNQEANHE